MLTHIEFLKKFDKYKDEEVFILIGPEDYPIRAIREKFIDYETRTFWGDEISIDKIVEFFNQSSLFSKKGKLAIIRNFEKLKKWKEILKLKNKKVILYSSLDFYEEDLKKLNKVVEEFIGKNLSKSDKYTLVLMPYLTEGEKKKWIIKRLNKLNLMLSAEQMDYLFRNLPKDLSSCNNEVEKIYLAGSENLELILSKSENLKVYSFINYLEKGNFDEILKLVKEIAPLELNMYILRTILNMIYIAENTYELVKPSLFKHSLSKITKKLEKNDLIELLYLSLLVDRSYKTFHRDKISILNLVFRISHKVH
ncbi:MAG: hypothetical protein RMJ38_02870 [candidate division WOR-3 bacterium]|nr:hypothetical protein [candidate division WOR-3 bacterium]MDW8150368.1 hypothetical protein [candidate division WOR-3 bacterium]